MSTLFTLVFDIQINDNDIFELHSSKTSTFEDVSAPRTCRVRFHFTSESDSPDDIFTSAYNQVMRAFPKAILIEHPNDDYDVEMDFGALPSEGNVQVPLVQQGPLQNSLHLDIPPGPHVAVFSATPDGFDIAVQKLYEGRSEVSSLQKILAQRLKG